MLKETNRAKFWTYLHIKPTMTKDGDLQIYTDPTNNQTIGIINTFNRRYFLIEKDEGLKDRLQAHHPPSPTKNTNRPKNIKTPLDTYHKYPHAIPGTLTHDAAAKKDKVRIRCCDCGCEERWVYTSDLFHTKRCRTCQDKHSNKKKTEAQAIA